MKANDFLLSADQEADVRHHADRLLRKANAYGVFPTPVKEIIKASGLRVKYIQELLPRESDAPETVKRAAGKLQGILHREEDMILIDKGLITQQRKFVSLHEVAHHWLPHHRELYKILEDSAEELDEETRVIMEREANIFASEVIFQVGQFTSAARGLEFGIGAPVKLLSKRFGAGNYSTIRRYTRACGRRAAVLVCDANPEKTGALTVRRFIPSPEFLQHFGDIPWPETLGPDSWFARNRPKNMFMLPSQWAMKFPQGSRVNCLVEGFDSSRQVFFFIYPEEEAYRACWDK